MASAGAPYHQEDRSKQLYRDFCEKCGARRIDSQIGLEASPDEYVATMVAVLREVRRVLKDDGTVWCNLGDSYAGGPSGSFANGSNRGRGMAGGEFRANKAFNTACGGLKSKDLCGIPWRVAFALQADGWYLRADIIWAKPNPMPEPVRDRPTRSHEYLFLLTKRANYYYDADAIREPGSPNTAWCSDVGKPNKAALMNPEMNHNGTGKTGLHNNDKYREIGRNRRDVWTINSEATPEAHFATFPQALVTPCVLAGTSEKGECSACGANWVREVESWIEGTKRHENGRYANHDGSDLTNSYLSRTAVHGTKHVLTTGWRPSCACNAPTRPNLVFDPFLGSGTVGEVCERLGQRWAGLDLSAPYIRIARNRTRQMGLRW